MGLSEGEALPVLREGEVIGGRQIPWSSNQTFLVRLDAGPGLFVRAVYKPKAGERPLFDFPGGTLYKREQAAFVLGMAIGWPPVLLTTIREGALRHRLDAAVRRVGPADHLLRPDREQRRPKGRALRPRRRRTVWSIDHGLTFHRSSSCAS